MMIIRYLPIVFSAPMVRAIQGGLKTVTRRAIKTQPHIDVSGNFCVGNSNYGQDIDGKPVTKHFINRCSPYGKPGDRLWVREELEKANDCAIGYPADGAWLPDTPWMWKRDTLPAMFMPRAACRFLLEVTAVRVERLQDISESLAMAEGIVDVAFRPDDDWPICTGYMVGPDDGKTALETTAVKAFAGLWKSVGGDWDANPWVWVVEFKRVTQ